MNTKAALCLITALTLANLSGCNYFSDPYERIVKNWCDEKNGKYSRGSKSFPAYPKNCKVPVYKGKANIIVGYEVFKFSSKIVDYDTGQRDVFVQIPNKEKSGWANEKSRGHSHGWREGYDEVVIGSYILTNAP